MKIPKNKKFILKNGLRVLFLESKSSKSSGLGLAVNAGPYFESDGEEGISHLLEHLLGRSVVKGRILREEIYEKGGTVDAATSVSQTFFHLYTMPDKINELTNYLIEGVFTPKFTAASLKLAKESVLSELAFNQDFSSYEILREMMWKDRRLARPIVGSKTSMLGTSLESINKYHKKYYCANNASVVVIGPEFSDELLHTLENIPVNKKFEPLNISLNLKKPSYKIYEERNLHSIIAFAFPTKGYKGLGENRHIFNIAATALNDYYVFMLGKMGLVYEASWNWNVFPESGDFIVLLESLAENHLVPALDQGLQLISKWPELKLSNKKFELLKSHRILDLRIGASLVDALPLFTRNFSSSEEAHTYEEAIDVYEKATMEETLETVHNVLLTQKPYTVISVGTDSFEKIGKLNQLLEDYYK